MPSHPIPTVAERPATAVGPAPASVVLLTVDDDREDVYLTRRAFLAKPVTAAGMKRVAQRVDAFWFGTAVLPVAERRG